MSFTTYKNTVDRHVTIHRDGCGQIRKRGGEHHYGQGEYKSHGTYKQVHDYAKATNLKVIHCSFCKPQ